MLVYIDFFFLKEWVIAFDKYCLVWPQRWERKESRNHLKAFEWQHVSVCVFVVTLSTLVICNHALTHFLITITTFPKVPDSIPDSYLVWMAYFIGKPINTSTVVLLASLHGNEISRVIPKWHVKPHITILTQGCFSQSPESKKRSSLRFRRNSD